MMAKRSSFQFRQPRAKMPKLDVTILSSQCSQVAGPSRLSNVVQNIPSPPQPAQSVDMWGDDDEEFIMLASQAAEKVEAHAEQVLSQAMNMHESNISYECFRRDVEASTQLSKMGNINDPVNDFMCSNDDEDVFANLPDFQPNAARLRRIESTARKVIEVEKSNFLVPAIPSTSSNQQQMEKTKIEAQNNFLSNKLRTQKKEIETLKENLSKVSDKCQTKEGEASTLRYELDWVKQQSDRLRKEKLAEIQQMEKDYLEKLTNLEKIIEAQRSEIEFKNIEILNKKSRRSLNDSIASAANDHHMPLKADAYSLLRLQTSSYLPDTPLAPLSLPNNLFIDLDELPQMHSEKNTSLLRHLHNLQSILNQVNATKHSHRDERIMQQIYNLIDELKAFLLNYAMRLDLPSYTKYNPTVEFRHLSEAERRKNEALAKSAIKCEKLIQESRIITIIALLCRTWPILTQALLSRRQPKPSVDGNQNEGDVEPSFIETLIEVITAIGFAKTIHESFIEACSLLLTSIAGNYIPSERTDVTLNALFKAIAFCQPKIKSLKNLTDFLVTISKQKTSTCCANLCSNTNTGNIICYPRYNIKRYSPDTCPLQVYASLLETAFDQYESVGQNTSTVITLAHITIGIVTFLRNCFKRSVGWLFRKTGSDNESVYLCHCYCYIVTSAIVLLHLCIKRWIEHTQTMDIKSIEMIIKMAAIFLHDNLNQHYEPKVLQLGGMPIKNRLQVLYDWITFYHRLFAFSDSHLKAIQSVNLRRITLMNEPQRISAETHQQSILDQLNQHNCAVLIDTFDSFTIKS